MRVWDISPGYLNQQSLLGEHLELHAVVSILVNKKKGYANHPETIRWKSYGWALKIRHQQLEAEMSLRGIKHNSPVFTYSGKDLWPVTYIDAPFHQIQILKSKYRDKEQGRIQLPNNAQQYWSQHKYSILARDVSLYNQLGKDVSKMKAKQDFSEITMTLTELLRTPPSSGGMRNALQHMWGHVSDYPSAPQGTIESWSPVRLFKEIQKRAVAKKEPYLTSSTALSELKVWLPKV